MLSNKRELIQISDINVVLRRAEEALHRSAFSLAGEATFVQHSDANTCFSDINESRQILTGRVRGHCCSFLPH